MKKIAWIFLVIIILILSCVIVYSSTSLSLTPGGTSVFFEPNKEISFSFRVRNKESVERKYELVKDSTMGYLKTNFENEVFSLGAGQSRTINGKIKFPEKMNPGEHEYMIMITTLSPGRGGVSARAAVGYVIRIYVPYPGKYIQGLIRLNRENSLGSPTPLKAIIKNLGTEDLNNVYVRFDVYFNGEVVKSLTTKSRFMKSKTERDFIEYIPPNSLDPGEYLVGAEVFYDGLSKNLTKSHLTLGDVFVDILDSTKSFTAGKINKINIELRSMWNSPIGGVYVDSELMKKDVIFATAKSQSVTMKPWNVVDLQSFIDLAGIEPGIYKLKHTVHFRNKQNEKEFKVKVYAEEKAEQKPIIAEPKGPSTLTIVLVTIIIMLIIFGLILYFLAHRGSDEEGEEE